MVPMHEAPTSTNTTAPQQHRSQQQPSQEGGQPGRVAWSRPDFEAFDTALEVTAYAARD